MIANHGNPVKPSALEISLNNNSSHIFWLPRISDRFSLCLWCEHGHERFRLKMSPSTMCVEQNLSKSLGYGKGMPYSGGPEAQDQDTERFRVCWGPSPTSFIYLFFFLNWGLAMLPSLNSLCNISSCLSTKYLYDRCMPSHLALTQPLIVGLKG